MMVLLLIIALLLVIGPLRRSFISNRRFTFPAAAAAIAVWVGSYFMGGLPGKSEWYLLLPFMLAASLIVGRIAKEWFDEVFEEDK